MSATLIFRVFSATVTHMAQTTAVEDLNALHAEIVGAFNKSDLATLAALGGTEQLNAAILNNQRNFYLAALNLLAQRIDALEKRL